ncbi:hypothetical protein [Duganella sp. BJB476]|uniref:hypothetical protein n=1 Tax=Duganella sp. BJB476 TaxID=1871176 RepID=UPI000E349CC8|nr:hypothetical protein [Duganella sp. BJB476]RFP32431.1 hypothetical protein D0T21_09510 [Duganella sp. BJB476]
MDDRLLNQYCLDWVHWCYTRRYYIAPGGKSALAAMQPSKTGLPPNARLDPDMQFFNMAIHTLADMKDHRDAMVCFNLFYVEQADNVKRLADKLGISRPTYYNRVKSFARRAFILAQSLKKAHVTATVAVEPESPTPPN